MNCKTTLLALGTLALVACAKDPTEILVTVSAEEAVTRPITSLAVQVTDPAGVVLGGGSFIYLAAPPPDADVAAWVFPAVVRLSLRSSSPSGDVAILVEGRDPSTDNLVTARGLGAGTVAPQTTMQGAVTLLAVPLPVPDGGVPDGEVADADGADALTDPDAAAPL